MSTYAEAFADGREQGWADKAAEIERLRAALVAIIDNYDTSGDPPWTVTAIEDARKLINPTS